MTLGQLVEYAYNLQQRELAGGPSWVREDWFDVTATTAAEVDPNQIRLMLRSLLADRFQLLVEQETRTGTVYRLTARNVRGLNPPAKPGERSPVSTWRNDKNGFLSYEYIGHNATMEHLARTRSRPQARAGQWSHPRPRHSPRRQAFAELTRHRD